MKTGNILKWIAFEGILFILCCIKNMEATLWTVGTGPLLGGQKGSHTTPQPLLFMENGNLTTNVSINYFIYNNDSVAVLLWGGSVHIWGRSLLYPDTFIQTPRRVDFSGVFQKGEAVNNIWMSDTALHCTTNLQRLFVSGSYPFPDNTTQTCRSDIPCLQLIPTGNVYNDSAKAVGELWVGEQITKVVSGFGLTFILTDQENLYYFGCNAVFGGLCSNYTRAVSRDLFYGRVQDISLGNEHAIVLSNGQLYGVGRNSFGQLCGAASFYPTFTSLGISESVLKITAGAYSIMFTTISNNLYGCGLNSNGQLGDGTQFTRSTATKVIKPTSRSTITIYTLSGLNNTNVGTTFFLSYSIGKVVLYTVGRCREYQCGSGFNITNNINLLQLDYTKWINYTSGDKLSQAINIGNISIFSTVTTCAVNPCTNGVCKDLTIYNSYVGKTCSCIHGYTGPTCAEYNCGNIATYRYEQIGSSDCFGARAMCMNSEVVYRGGWGIGTPEDGIPTNTIVKNIPGYGCFAGVTEQNSAWFYFKVLQGGTLSFNLIALVEDDEYSGDLDFIVWGPFGAQAESDGIIQTCGAFLKDRQVACSQFRGPSILSRQNSLETVEIPAVVSNTYYVMLINDISGNTSFTVQMTSSNTATLDCSLRGLVGASSYCILGNKDSIAEQGTPVVFELRGVDINDKFGGDSIKTVRSINDCSYLNFGADRETNNLGLPGMDSDKVSVTYWNTSFLLPETYSICYKSPVGTYQRIGQNLIVNDVKLKLITSIRNRTSKIPPPQYIRNAAWIDVSPREVVVNDNVTYQLTGLAVTQLKAYKNITAKLVISSCREVPGNLVTEEKIFDKKLRVIFSVQSVGVYKFCIKYNLDWEEIGQVEGGDSFKSSIVVSTFNIDQPYFGHFSCTNFLLQHRELQNACGCYFSPVITPPDHLILPPTFPSKSILEHPTTSVVQQGCCDCMKNGIRIWSNSTHTWGVCFKD